MPINVFGNSSNNPEHKIDTSMFVQKPYLRANYIEAKIGEDIDLQNQFRFKNLPDSLSIREAASTNYVDNKFDDPSITKSNNPHPDIDLNYKNIINVGLIEVNLWPEWGDQVTSKLSVNNLVGNSVDELTLLRLDPDEKLNLDEQDSMIFDSTSTSFKTDIEISNLEIEMLTKNYVDKKFDDPSIIKNTSHVDFNEKNLDNLKFIKVNSFAAIPEHLTAKIYVDHATSYSVDASILFKLDPEEKLSLDKQDSIFLNSTLTSPQTIIDIPTNKYVDSLQESSRNRRELLSIFNDQDNEFDNNKLTNLDSVIVNRDPSSDNELANKKYVDDSIGKGTLLKFVQTLQNYLKASVGNSVYILIKYNKIQITNATEIKFPNIRSDLLQKWNIKSNNKTNQSRITDFIKSTKTNSPTGYSGATSLPPIGNSFMYIETSSNKDGHERVFVSLERTDLIQISNNTFFYNRFSILNNDFKKSMGRFRILLLLEDNTRSTRYNIPKNDPYSDSSTQWTLVNLNFTVENYGNKLVHDQIDTPHADMCYSNITITHSVY